MVKKLIDKDEDVMQAAQAMKAIAHPLRLKILCVLGDSEVSVQDIVDQVGTSQSNISQHLAIMRDKGVLRTRKDANRVFYRVGDTRTLELISMIRDVFCGFAIWLPAVKAGFLVVDSQLAIARTVNTATK